MRYKLRLRPRTTFDREFRIVCDELVHLSQMVDLAIMKAMQALTEFDLKLAEDVIASDLEVNQLRFKIEEDCMALIATRHPAASDLRAVIAVMHMVIEMERMGDYAAGIARTVIMMSEEPLLKTLKKIPRMGESSRAMLADCVQAFLKRDKEWAKQIADQDSAMDALYKDVFDRLVEIMAKKPDMVTRATYLMWCAHNLERIADRVTNIAEQVIFIATGTMEELNINEKPGEIASVKSVTAVTEDIEKSEKVEKGKKKTHHDTR